MSLKRWEPAATVNAPHAQIEYVLRGVDHRRDSADVVDVAFEAVDKVRTPKSWKHKKNYTGQYWAATTGGHVWFESLYERVALMQMDRDPAVAAISSQRCGSTGREHLDATRPTSSSASATDRPRWSM